MAKLDARFSSLDASNNFNEILFDKTNKSVNNSKLLAEPKQTNFDTENTKKFQVSFNNFNTSIAGRSLLDHYRNKPEFQEDDNISKNLAEYEYELNSNFPKHTEMTPMYTKNPNMTNNKIGEINELSRDENDMKNNKSIYIEPSPSGITRCFVKYDEKKSIEAETPHQPNCDKSRFNQQLSKPSGLFIQSYQRDVSTSPFVFLNPKINEAQNVVREPTHMDAGTQFETTVSRTPMSIKKNELNNKSLQTGMNTINLEDESKIVVEKVVTEKAKEPNKLNKLEKSKVVFVNLTPKPNPNTNDISEIKPTNNVNFLSENRRLNTQLNDLTEMSDYPILNNSNQISVNKNIDTPKFYPNQSERLMSIAEEKSSEKLETNEILNKKTLSYYDNIIREEHAINVKEDVEKIDEFDFQKSFSRNNLDSERTAENSHFMNQDLKQKDQMVQFPTPIQNMESLVIDQTSSNSNDMQLFRNREVNQLKRYNLSTIEEEQDETALECVKTYYNGNKLWTSSNNEKYQENKGFEKSAENINEKSSQHEITDEEKPYMTSKKNVNHVKIKLPHDSFGNTTMPHKERKFQKFCFNFFLILIFLCVISVLAYFIGFDKLGREKLFSFKIWGRLFK